MSFLLLFLELCFFIPLKIILLHHTETRHSLGAQTRPEGSHVIPGWRQTSQQHLSYWRWPLRSWESGPCLRHRQHRSLGPSFHTWHWGPLLTCFQTRFQLRAEAGPARWGLWIIWQSAEVTLCANFLTLFCVTLSAPWWDNVQISDRKGWGTWVSPSSHPSHFHSRWLWPCLTFSFCYFLAKSRIRASLTFFRIPVEIPSYWDQNETLVLPGELVIMGSCFWLWSCGPVLSFRGGATFWYFLPSAQPSICWWRWMGQIQDVFWVEISGLVDNWIWGIREREIARLHLRGNITIRLDIDMDADIDTHRDMLIYRKRFSIRCSSRNDGG